MGLRMVQNAVAKKHAQLLNADRKIQSALARDIYVMYQNAQVRRFASVSGNAGGTTSEGDSWPGLSASYRKYKPRRFSRYPEGGRRMLIATGSLMRVVIGTSRQLSNPESGAQLGHRKITEPRRLIVAIEGQYPKYVNEVRPFMSFGKQFWGQARARIRQYFLMGE